MERRDIQPGQFPGGQDLIGGETGFVIGARGDELLRLDTDSHLVTVAKTGGGKGRSVTIPNLLAHPGSVFSVEIGGATLNATIRYRRDILRQKIHVFDPYGMTDEPCASLNILDTLDPERLSFDVEVNRMTESLMQDSNGEKEQQTYFRNKPEELLSALIIHVKTASEEEVPSEKRNFPYVAELLSKYGTDEWDKLMLVFKTDTGRFKRILNKVGNYYADVGRNEHFDSLISSTAQWLSFAETEGLEKILTTSSVNLSDLRNDKITIYIVMPDVETYKSKKVNPWLRLMIEQSISSCPNRGDAGMGFKYEDRVLFMLDEFTNLGRLEAVEAGMQTTRQKGITLWPVFQDIGQLQKVYGKENAASFLGAAACRQFFAITEETTADYISKFAGKNIALIPAVSQAVGASKTETTNNSTTFMAGKSFAEQHTLNKSKTESVAHSYTNGWSKSEADAFTRGGSSGSSYSSGPKGGSSTSSSGSNWSQTRTVTNGISGSDGEQMSLGNQEGISEGETKTNTVQGSWQQGTALALGETYTVTVSYTPQIIPRLDVADVCNLLNNDDSQILFVIANGLRTIVDGRANYDQVPMLRYRSLGPEAPAFPVPLHPLESPKQLSNDVESIRLQIVLPAVPLSSVSFPRLETLSSSALHEAQMKRGDKLAAVKEIAAQIQTLHPKALSIESHVKQKAQSVRTYADRVESAHEQVMADTSSLIRSQGRLSKYENLLNAYAANLKRDARTDEKFFEEIPQFKQYTEFYHYLREQWAFLPEPSGTVALEGGHKYLKHANEPFNVRLLEPRRFQRQELCDISSLESVPTTVRLRLPRLPDIEAHFKKHQTWVYPEINPPTLYDVVVVDGGAEKIGVVKAIRNLTGVSYEKAASLIGKNAEAFATVNPVQAGEYKRTLQAAGASVELRPREDSRKPIQGKTYGLTEIEQNMVRLDNARKSPKKLFARIEHMFLQAIGQRKTNKQITEEIGFFSDARERLTATIFTEAYKDLQKYRAEVQQTNNAIADYEREWGQYYRSLQNASARLGDAAKSNVNVYEVLCRELTILHKRRDDLDRANKILTGQRVRKALEVSTWDIWDRYQQQTKRLKAQDSHVPEVEKHENPKRPEDLTKEMPTGVKKTPKPS